MKESCAMTEGREKVMQRVVGGLCTMSVVKIRSVAFSNIGQYGRYLPSITVNLSPRRKLMKTLRVVVVEVLARIFHTLDFLVTILLGNIPPSNH